MQQYTGGTRPCSSHQLAVLLLGCLAVLVPQALGQACSNYTVCVAAPRIRSDEAVAGCTDRADDCADWASYGFCEYGFWAKGMPIYDSLCPRTCQAPGCSDGGGGGGGYRYTFAAYIPTRRGLCFFAASALDVSQITTPYLAVLSGVSGAPDDGFLEAVAFQSTSFPANHSSSAWIVAACDGCSTSSSGVIKMVQLTFTWSDSRESNINTCVVATAAKYLPVIGNVVLTSGIVNAAWSNTNATAMTPVNSVSEEGYGVPYIKLQTGGVSSECGMLSRAMGLTWSNSTAMTTSCGLTAPGFSRPIETPVPVFFYCMTTASATVYERQLKQAWGIAQPTPKPAFTRAFFYNYYNDYIDESYRTNPVLWLLFTCPAASMPPKTSYLTGQWLTVYNRNVKLSPPPPLITSDQPPSPPLPSPPPPPPPSQQQQPPLPRRSPSLPPPSPPPPRLG